MRQNKLGWIVPLAALAAASGWWMMSGERDATAKDPVKPPDKAGAADAGAPAAPTIAGVFPPSGSSGAQVIMIQGDHFGSSKDKVKIYYGRNGFPHECNPVPPVAPATTSSVWVSEKLVRCTLSGQPPLGEAQHFVVSVEPQGGEKVVQSDASTATYTLLGPATVSKHEAAPSAGGGLPPYVQVHIQGTNFSLEGGDAPSVSCGAPACTVALPCRNVLLISPGELFCSLPSDKYAGGSPGGFTIVRAGEQ